MSRHDPRALRSPSRMKVNANVNEVTMPSMNDETDCAKFLAGDMGAGDALYRRLKAPLLLRICRRAPTLPAEVAEDVVSETFALMIEKGALFDPRRGSALGFIAAQLVPEALRRVRAENVPPGAPKRVRKGKAAKAPPAPARIDEALNLPSVGFGSPSATEAACDAHMIWSQATPTVQVAIGGMLDGKTLTEIAFEMKTNRFVIARVVKSFRQAFALAA